MKFYCNFSSNWPVKLIPMPPGVKHPDWTFKLTVSPSSNWVIHVPAKFLYWLVSRISLKVASSAAEPLPEFFHATTFTKLFGFSGSIRITVTSLKLCTYRAEFSIHFLGASQI